MKRKFTWELTPYYDSGTTTASDGSDNCADLYITNEGTVSVIINGAHKLTTGQTLSLPAFGEEQQEGVINYQFTASGNTKIVIGRKRYR